MIKIILAYVIVSLALVATGALGAVVYSNAVSIITNDCYHS